jgi:hypothetical protein
MEHGANQIFFAMRPALCAMHLLQQLEKVRRDILVEG